MKFQFDSFSDFIAMGGYAEYVWTVYALFAFFIVINLIPPLRAHKAILRQLKARLERENNT